MHNDSFKKQWRRNEGYVAIAKVTAMSHGSYQTEKKHPKLGIAKLDE